MADYFSTVVWERNEQAFTDNKYSRGHTWRFDGGLEIPASSSPHVVPLPFSVEQIEKMHHLSHEQCYIANSVKTKVVTEIIP